MSAIESLLVSSSPQCEHHVLPFIGTTLRGPLEIHPNRALICAAVRRTSC
jgi:hypothetical protein